MLQCDGFKMCVAASRGRCLQKEERYQSRVSCWSYLFSELLKGLQGYQKGIAVAYPDNNRLCSDQYEPSISLGPQFTERAILDLGLTEQTPHAPCSQHKQYLFITDFSITGCKQPSTVPRDCWEETAMVFQVNLCRRPELTYMLTCNAKDKYFLLTQFSDSNCSTPSSMSSKKGTAD